MKVASLSRSLQIAGSAGMSNLMRRTAGWVWKECVWFAVRRRAREELIERTVLGNRMYLSLRDPGLSKILAVYMRHEPISTGLFRQEIREGMCVVDIGANLGYYALQEADLVGRTGRVIAIEPVPSNAYLLRKNVQANGYQNVQIYEGAVGTHNGTAKLYVSPESNWASLIPGSMHNGSVDVQLWSLDSLLRDESRIDYVRMDVEGSETEIIQGMGEILHRHRPGIFMEAHAYMVCSESFIGMLNNLKEAGYRTKYVIDKAYEYPTVGRRYVVETISIDELKADRRIAKAQGVIMLFLVAKGQSVVPGGIIP
jgi:FkbM family methyltransferase